MSGRIENPSNVAINTANTASYLSADRSELAPLYNNPQEAKGIRAIATFFTIFSVFVTLVLAIQLHYGNHQIAQHGSVTTDSIDCSDIGASMIKIGGNAIDAAVASTFCMGVVNPHLTGLGGGGLMVIYDQRQRHIKDCLDFRVVKSRSSSVGVPGFLAGLYQAHEHHGILSWKQLIAPSIDLARSGYHVSNSLLSAKEILKDNSSDLFSWLMPLQAGQLMVNFGLADSLEAIANFGPDAFYNGNLTEELITYGNLIRSDVSSYNVLRGLSGGGGVCTEHVYNGYKIVLPDRGSGGPLLTKTLDLLNLTYTSSTPIATVGKAIMLGNNSEVSWPLHSGSVVVATDRTDLYVSIVSGLGSILGSKILLPSGYILNNGVEIASLTSGNRVTSLSVPFVAVEADHVCGRRLISGAADARDAVQLLYGLISSASVPITTNSTDIEKVVESPRVRFTATYNTSQVWVEYQHIPGLPKAELISLKEEGFISRPANLPYPSLNVIQKINDLISAHADSRGEGYHVTF